MNIVIEVENKIPQMSKKVARLDPLSFTYVITLLNKLNELNNILT